MSKEMNELSKYFYDIYYRYEGAKENLFWVGFALYFTFSGVVIKWLLENYKIHCLSGPIPQLATASLTLVFIFAFWFVGLQNWYKAKSAQTSDELVHLLTKESKVEGFRADEKLQIYNAITHLNRKHKAGEYENMDRSFLHLFCTKGKSGIIVLILMLIFFIAQIALLWLL
jgi:hypothetical protein